jgi:hypothetical protein
MNRHCIHLAFSTEQEYWEKKKSPQRRRISVRYWAAALENWGAYSLLHGTLEGY